MQFRSEALSGAARLALRAGLLLIPVTVAALLLYVASEEQEALHHANLRWLAQMAAQIRDKIANQENLVRDRAKLASADDGGSGTRADAAYSIAALKPATPGCDPGNWVHLSVVDAAGHLQLRFADSTGKKPVCAWSDLAEIVAPVLSRSTFTSIVLAERNGRVLYRSGPETLQITDVSFLFAPTEAPARTARAATQPGVAEPPPPPPEPPTASMHLHRMIGETKYAVFVQPVPLSLGSDSGAGSGQPAGVRQWLLIGLTQKDSLLPAASPHDLIALLPFALLLAAFAWPLHRLWAMHPLDPLRRRDLAAFIVCSLGVLTVLTVVWLSESLRRGTADWADGQLFNFARALGENVACELSAALRQLHLLDDLAQRQPNSAASVVDRVLERRLTPDQVHVLFDYADWVRPDGEKRVRWTTRAVTPQALNVANRKYFLDVVTGSTLQIPRVSDKPFAIEQVLSRTSGETATMLAVRSRTTHHSVVSLSLKLVSLNDPVFPRDVGFAVIDSTGKALFHSESSRVFLENVFDECWQSQSLRAVVSSRVPAYLDVDYGAAAHRFYVTPLPGLEQIPWTLIVYRKVAGTRVSRMQILTDTSALLLLYAAILLLAGLAAFGGVAVTGRPRPFSSAARVVRSLRRTAPMAALAGLALVFLAVWTFLYAQGTGLFVSSVVGAAAFLLVVLIAAAAGRTAALPALALVVAAAALLVFGRSLAAWMLVATAGALGLLAFTRRRTSHTFQATLTRKSWNVLVAEFVLLCCVAPTLLLARLAFDYELSLRIRSQQLQLWKAGTERRRALTRTLDNTPGVDVANTSDGAKAAAMRAHLLRVLRLTPTTVPGERPLYQYGTLTPASDAAGASTPELPGEGTRSSGFVEAVLAGLELPYEQRLLGADARRRRLEPAGKPSLWTWTENGGVLRFYADGSLRATSPLPAFGALLDNAGSTFWAGLPALPVIAAVWFGIVRRRLSAIPVPQPSAAAALPPGHRRYVLLPAYAASAAVETNGARRIDLALSPEFVLAGPDEIPESGVVLDRFETRFADPTVRDSRLALLEQVLWSDRPVTVISRIDPLRYLSGAEQPNSAELGRWSSVVGWFERGARTQSWYTRRRCHAAVWEECSWQEKVLLSNLASHPLLNPNAVPLVEGLVERGVLRVGRGGRLRFRCPGLREFARDVVHTPQFLQRPAAQGTRRLPAYAVGLVLLGFVLFVSQEEITTRLIGFLTTVTGGFEAIRKHLASANCLPDGAKKA